MKILDAEFTEQLCHNGQQYFTIRSSHMNANHSIRQLYIYLLLSFHPNALDDVIAIYNSPDFFMCPGLLIIDFSHGINVVEI